MTRPHRKTHPSLQMARREQSLLHLVAGDGIVPVHGTDDQSGCAVITARGRGSLADLLVASGRLPEAAARGTGARVAGTLARLHAAGVVHGDVKPSNIVFAPDGDLWLVDFDAAGMEGTARRRATLARLPHSGDLLLRTSDDVIALAVMIVECATGVLLDPSVEWTEPDLQRVGCSADLAADVHVIFTMAPSASRVGALLHRRDSRLPAPPGAGPVADPTPTIDIPPVTITGLDPITSPCS